MSLAITRMCAEGSSFESRNVEAELYVVVGSLPVGIQIAGIHLRDHRACQWQCMLYESVQVNARVTYIL